MANRFEMLHPSFVAAYLRLQDPRHSIELELLEKGAPGIRDLHNAHFPPRDIHQDLVPADFTFKTLKGRRFQIQMMPHLVGNESGDIFVMGFWRHSQARGNEELGLPAVDPDNEVQGQDRFFAVRYTLHGKRGNVFLPKPLHDVIEKYCG